MLLWCLLDLVVEWCVGCERFQNVCFLCLEWRFDYSWGGVPAFEHLFCPHPRWSGGIELNLMLLERFALALNRPVDIFGTNTWDVVFRVREYYYNRIFYCSIRILQGISAKILSIAWSFDVIFIYNVLGYSFRLNPMLNFLNGIKSGILIIIKISKNYQHPFNWNIMHICSWGKFRVLYSATQWM